MNKNKVDLYNKLTEYEHEIVKTKVKKEIYKIYKIYKKYRNSIVVFVIVTLYNANQLIWGILLNFIIYFSYYNKVMKNHLTLKILPIIKYPNN